jgi:GntR family transcriptional regulator, rspAB operon transcriptional repressor
MTSLPFGPPALASVAYNELRARIIGCEVLPGTPLTEKQVVEQLGIGKTPVREAMRRLVQDGLLRVAPRSGYRVTPITLDDVDEAFEVRSILEVAAAEGAAGRLDASTLGRLETLSRIGYDAGDAESVRDFLRLNREFHHTIALATGNGRLAAMVGALLDESQRCIHLGILTHPRSHAAQVEHTALLDAIRLGDRDAARREVLAQLAASREMVREDLATLRGVASTA